MLKYRSARWLVLLLMLATRPGVAQFDAAVERSLFDSANQERAKAGLPAFTWDDKLMQAARLHAEKMAAEKKLTHRAEGEPRLLDRIAAKHLSFDFAAENVASAGDPEDIHPSWMNSPGHRANILSAKANALGVGVLHFSGGYYAVQDFAHVTSSDSSAVAEQRFITAFLAARRAKGRPRVGITSLSSLRAFACDMAKHDSVSVRSLGMEQGFHAAMGFNTSEPEEFPERVQALALDFSLGEIRVGACYGATTSRPGGGYWFVIVY